MLTLYWIRDFCLKWIHTLIKTPTLFKFYFVHLSFSSKSGEFRNKNEHLSSGNSFSNRKVQLKIWILFKHSFNEIILSFQIHIWYFNQGNHRVIKKIQTKFTIEPNKLNGLIKNQINHFFLEKKSFIQCSFFKHIHFFIMQWITEPFDSNCTSNLEIHQN
jgi:hypothetical protein